ncbi:MAG: hypothetical protein ABJJ53_15430 [Sulfitobacter sp.]
MMRPQNLLDDLTTVKAAGVNTIVSLLEQPEAQKAGLGSQPDACTALNLTYLNHPIRDMQLPDPDAFADFSANIAARLHAGAHVAVHCFASIGRTGMLTCTTLGHFGYDAASALSLVSQLRGVAVPDTPQQADFIKRMIAAQNA